MCSSARSEFFVGTVMRSQEEQELEK
jgi:hypothetical protein